MRKWFAKALALGLTLALVAGCAQKATEQPKTEQPKAAAPKKEVKVTLPYMSFDSLDPQYWTSQLLIAQGTIREGLFGYDDKLNVVPKIAESFDKSADFKKWTFKLRKDKKWANGDPVTAKDFAAAWLLFMSPEKKDTPMWAGAWGNIKNAWAYKSGGAKKEEVGVKVIDDYTIEVELSQPHTYFHGSLVMAQAMPIPHKLLETNPKDWWDPKHKAFNGPYMVQAWTKGGETVLVRNPNYVGDKYGNVDTIVLKPFSDPNATMQAFENGEIQYMSIGDTAQKAYVQKNAKLKEGYKEDMGIAWSGIQYNRAANHGPWGDVRVRQAFALAIDKAAIAEKVMKGRAVPAKAFTGDERITSKVTGLSYDVAKAKKLLAEAGFPDGKGLPEVMFYAPPANDGNMPMIEAIAKMWQDNLGVKVKIENMEWGPYSGMQWGNQHKDRKPGYTIMSGAMNYLEPMGLYQNVGHIWWFMDKTAEWKTKRYYHWEDAIKNVDKVTAVGDFNALKTRADKVWAERQKIVAVEKNTWGKNMVIAPTFIETFGKIAERFKAAKDDKEKLGAYKDALRLVLQQERSVEEYNMLPETNKKAMRLMEDLFVSTLEKAPELLVPLNQMALDSAWQVPIHIGKIMYVTDPKLSGVVQNKLSWGNIFQFNYLKYNQ